MQETLTGVLEKIIFSNQDNHYTIGKFKPENTPRITIAGHLPNIQCGETLTITGKRHTHPQYGERLNIDTFKPILPASIHGIRKYLGSGLIPNIGPVYAKKIVNAFGKDTLKIISEDSGKLLQVAGIGKKRAQAIKNSWEKHNAIRSLMIFLQTYGIGNAICVKLVKRYGTHTQQLLQTQPYSIAREMKGIGFKTADQIALNIGLSNESNPRIQAGILHTLEELQSQGHTAYPIDTLCAHASQLLDIDPHTIHPHIQTLLQQGELVNTTHTHTPHVQTAQLHYAETTIARHLHDTLLHPSPLPSIHIDKALKWIQDTEDIQLSPEQNQAIRAALTHKINLLTGGPGTGKTTILRAIVNILKLKKVRLHLAAPTGRAAQK